MEREETLDILLKNGVVFPANENVSKILDVLNASDGENKELVNVIRKNVRATLKILSVANSPLYGLPRRVYNLAFAAVIIGFEHIRNIVIALDLNSSIAKPSGNFHFYLHNKHSVLTAMISKYLYEKMNLNKNAMGYSIGLLHNCGIPILSQKMKNFSETTKHIISIENEKNIFGITRYEMSSAVLEKLNFPREICEVIKNCETPSEAGNYSVHASILNFASVLAKAIINEKEWYISTALNENYLSTPILKDIADELLDTSFDDLRKEFKFEM